MKIAYLILAHNNPKHLQRLITSLSSSASSFFIHLDQKSDCADFSSIKGENIYFIKKNIAVFWGDFSIVEATLILLRTALLAQHNFERFVLLSGADYPIRSTAHIESFFEARKTEEFIDLQSSGKWHKEFVCVRLARYRIRSKHTNAVVMKVINKINKNIEPSKFRRDYKTYLGALLPYGGSDWWALSREACDFIFNFVKNNNKIVNFFKNTSIPSESFFHIILGNSNFKSKIVSSLTYADWTNSNNPNHPTYITNKHLALFNKASSFTKDGVFGGEKLFARKFPANSSDLIAKLLRV